MMPKICDGCDAVGETCCATAKARQENANSLSRIVNRQAETITRLTRERDEARAVLADINAAKKESAR